MKKRSVLLALVCILMGCMLLLFSCKEEHTHAFAAEWTSDATHHWHAATCEHTDQRSDYAEHAWDSGRVTVAPTEAAEGVKTFTCTGCGKTRTESIAALAHAHTFADTLSYDEGGHYYAATCGHSAEKKDYAAHTWNGGQVTAEPTETADGERTYTCTVCGKTRTEPITALGHTHTYREDVTAATCTTDGYTTYICACGYSYVGAPVAALTHNYQIASSNADGTHNLVCSHDATHTMTDECDYVQTVVLPACTTGGYTKYDCVCGHFYTQDEQDPDGHAFATEWSSDDAYHWHAATCDHVGQMKDYGEHQYTIFVGTTDPTCTADGYTTYACVCGKTQNRDVVSATGHAYSAFIEQNRALYDDSCCKYAISLEASCSVCGDVQTKTEYEEVHVFYTEKEPNGVCTVTGQYALCHATCQSAGYYHKHCENPECKYYTDAAQIIDMPIDPDAHVWNSGSQSGNVITYTCTMPSCGMTKTAVVADGNTTGNLGAGVDEVAIGSTTITMNQTMQQTLTKDEAQFSITAGVTEDEATKQAILESYGNQFSLADIGNKPIYSFTLDSTNPEIDGSNFGNGGKATITIPYRLEGGDNRNRVIVFYLSSQGLEAIEADYWEDSEGNGFATFQTGHFSDYVPTSVSPEKLCELFGEHSGDVHVVAPTCTTGGHTVCLRCNTVIATTAPLGHKWVSTVTASSSCSTNGTMHHACAECDMAYDTVIPATGHYYVLNDHTMATCKNEGSSVYGCIYCDGTYTVTTVQLSHQYVAKTVAPTCTDRGYTQRSCTLCGDVQTAYVAALGHDYETTWHAAEEGHYHTCLACGARGETVAHIPAEEEATEEYAQLCTVCEYVLVPQLTHEHKNMTHVTGKDATCTESGNKAYYICACGKWFLDEDGTQLITDHASVILDATGHTGEVIPYTEPGCETPGNTAGVRCTSCGKVLRGNVEIAPTGHDYKQTVVKPTCLEGGHTVFTCACGDSYTGNETAALGHRYTKDILAPTCTTSGYTTYTCLYCEEGTDGHSYKGDVVSALGHAYTAAWITDEDHHWHVCARCDVKDGYAAHIKDYESATEQHGVSCVACGYEIEAIKDHVHASARFVESQEATCTASGRLAYYVCACGGWFSDEACMKPISDRTSVLIPATGHTLTYHERVNATCYSNGYTEGYSCKKCGYEGGRVLIPMTDHNFNTPVLYDEYGHWHKCLTCTATDQKIDHKYSEKVTAPTCTAPGYTEFDCACGYSYVGAQTDALGHDFGEWKINYDGTHTHVCQTDPRHRETVSCDYAAQVVLPTCSEQGYTIHTCTACGHTYTDTYVNMLPHTFGKWESNGDGTHTRVCGRDASHTETVNCEYHSRVTPPTCEEQGYTTYQCQCGYSYAADYVDATGHYFELWHSNHDGTHIYYCKWDLNHTLLESCEYDSETVSPTCEEQGYVLHTCRICNDQYQDQHTAALGHAYGEWQSNGDGTHIHHCLHNPSHTELVSCAYSTMVIEPTCETDGYTLHTCVDCGYSYTDQYVAALDHVFGPWLLSGNHTHTRICVNNPSHIETLPCEYEVKPNPPTCSEPGFTNYRCTLCGHYYTDDYVDATGHRFENGICTDCGTPDPDYNGASANTIAVEMRYDEQSDRNYIALAVRNADLAGLRLRLYLHGFIESDVDCMWGAQYYVEGDTVNVIFSDGQNTVSDEIVILCLYVKSGYVKPNMDNVQLDVVEIYRFDEKGEIVVPNYTVSLSK